MQIDRLSCTGRQNAISSMSVYPRPLMTHIQHTPIKSAARGCPVGGGVVHLAHSEGGLTLILCVPRAALEPGIRFGQCTRIDFRGTSDLDRG